MRNVRRRFGVVLFTAGLVACAEGSSEGEPLVPGDDDPDISFPFPQDAGFSAPPPARLDKLIVSATPPPAISGGTLAVAKDGSVVVAADPDRDLVYVVRPKTFETYTVKLAAGSEPGRVALDGAGRAHVALRGRGSVQVIDLATHTAGTETPVCSLPRGIVYDARADTLEVACAGGELLTLAAADHAKKASADLGIDLRDIVLRADGSRDVTRYRSANLMHVADGTVQRTTAPASLTQQRFVVEESEPGTTMRDAGRVNGPFSDEKPSKQISVTMSPTLAWKTVAVGDGGTMMLHQASQDDEVVIASSGGYGGGCETITQAGLTYFDEQGKPVNTVTLMPQGLVVDLAVSPNGRFAALAVPGGYLSSGTTVEILPVAQLSTPAVVVPPVTHDAGVVDAGSPDEPRDPTPSFDAGFGGPGSMLPPSCASGSSGAYEEQVTSVAFDDDGVLYALSREPARLILYAPQDPTKLEVYGYEWPEVIEQGRFDLANTSVRDTGHELFHANVGSGLSCAGCHGEALDDGHVWNFRDFGPRRTQSMRGGLLSTLPLHWEGDMPTFKHLVDEVMTRRMGGFQVEERYGAALGQWLDKLPAMKLSASEDPAVARGKALYESTEVACATCHNGTHLTNNKSYDVGTGELLQVPTLLGIALHPPFLHDGCAATLEERFDPACGGGDRHGHTSHLTQAEIADLVSYLKTL